MQNQKNKLVFEGRSMKHKYLPQQMAIIQKAFEENLTFFLVLAIR